MQRVPGCGHGFFCTGCSGGLGEGQVFYTDLPTSPKHCVKHFFHILFNYRCKLRSLSLSTTGVKKVIVFQPRDQVHVPGYSEHLLTYIERIIIKVP